MPEGEFEFDEGWAEVYKTLNGSSWVCWGERIDELDEECKISEMKKEYERMFAPYHHQ